MKLIVSGMQSGEKTLFKHLWGRYIIGFRPEFHCQRSLVHKQATDIKPELKDGEYELDPSYELFYLCGVGWKDKGNTNVHLAVTPRVGSIASAGSVYGVQFTITDAQAIHIRYLEEGWKGLDKDHRGCKNFQFGWQMFEANQAGEAAKGKTITTLRSKRSLRREL